MPKDKKIFHGRRRPFEEELPLQKSYLTFCEKEVLELREYFALRERFFQLAFLCALVFAFFAGLAI